MKDAGAKAEADKRLLDAYWRAFPAPYERDIEDAKAAKRHIRAIERALANNQRP